ncbi:MAG: putative lipid II flippase FtsW [Candidatus Sericytochromatia bacterium]|nr:putative lipid II flippase FtsW [Candidatus Sericytochromatia bacterium]
MNRRLRARRSPQIDVTLLAIVLMLTGAGLLSILSASAPVAEQGLSHTLYYVQRQGMWCVVGLVALVAATFVNMTLIRGLAKWVLLATAALLMCTHVPGIGITELGSSRWLRVGPFSVQPSEVAKLSLAVYLADRLARQGDKPWSLLTVRHTLAPTLGVLALVLVQPDLGTTIVLAICAFAVFFAYGTRIWLLGGTALVAVAGVLYSSFNTDYQRQRWIGFLNPWAEPQGNGYQLVQSLMAIGSGGVLGVGFGQSKQKLFYLPIQYADFIFAVLAEEFGLIGCVSLLALFLLLAWRGISIAREARDPFHALLALALTTIVVGQAYINIGVVTASLPTTGIPLPFLSFGGSSLVITMFSMGLLLNISRHNHKAQEAQAAAENGALEARSGAGQP